MSVLGGILVAVAAGWFLYKLYVSYTSAGGTDFELPVYDAAFYPPILAAAGLYLVLPVFEISWSIWIYVAIWLGLTALAWGALRGAVELGDRTL